MVIGNGPPPTVATKRATGNLPGRKDGGTEMLNKLVPITLIAAIGVGIGGAAFADTEVGTIASVDNVCGTVTLVDGTTFIFDDEDYAARLHCFKAGDEVAVTYHHLGTKLEADAISPVNASFEPMPAVGEHGVDHLD